MRPLRDSAFMPRLSNHLTTNQSEILGIFSRGKQGSGREGGWPSSGKFCNRRGPMCSPSSTEGCAPQIMIRHHPSHAGHSTHTISSPDIGKLIGYLALLIGWHRRDSAISRASPNSLKCGLSTLPCGVTPLPGVGRASPFLGVVPLMHQLLSRQPMPCLMFQTPFTVAI